MPNFAEAEDRQHDSHLKWPVIHEQVVQVKLGCGVSSEHGLIFHLWIYPMVL